LLHPLLSDTKNLQAFLFSLTHYHQLSCDADGGASGEGTNDDTGAPPRRINALLLHPLLSESNNLQAFLFTSTHCHQLSCNADGGAEEQETDDDTGAPPRCLNALPLDPLLSDLQALLFSSTQ
jgi:hypothetical protein